MLRYRKLAAPPREIYVTRLRFGARLFFALPSPVTCSRYSVRYGGETTRWGGEIITGIYSRLAIIKQTTGKAMVLIC